MGNDVGTLSGGWKMRVALGADPARDARAAAARRADELPRSRVDPVARDVPARLRRHRRDDVPRPRDHEPRRRQDRRDRRRRAAHVHRQLRLLRESARDRGGAARGRVRAPAGAAREGEPVHRALQDARREGRAGAEPDQEARQDREGRGAAPHHRARRSTSARRRARATTSSSSTSVTKAYGDARRARRPDADRAPQASAGR